MAGTAPADFQFIRTRLVVPVHCSEHLVGRRTAAARPKDYQLKNRPANNYQGDCQNRADQTSQGREKHCGDHEDAREPWDNLADRR